MEPLTANLVLNGYFHWMLAGFGVFFVGAFGWLLMRPFYTGPHGPVGA